MRYIIALGELLVTWMPPPGAGPTLSRRLLSSGANWLLLRALGRALDPATARVCRSPPAMVVAGTGGGWGGGERGGKICFFCRYFCCVRGGYILMTLRLASDVTRFAKFDVISVFLVLRWRVNWRGYSRLMGYDGISKFRAHACVCRFFFSSRTRRILVLLLPPGRFSMIGKRTRTRDSGSGRLRKTPPMEGRVFFNRSLVDTF